MAHLSWYTGDATANTWVQDFSALVLAPPMPGADIALYSIIGKRMDGTEPYKYEWIEEQLTSITITGTCSSGQDWNSTDDTSWTFEVAELQAAGIRPGVILRDATDRTKKELILVTDVNTATGAVTVTRDYGDYCGATPDTHATTCTFEICGYLNWQGSSVDHTQLFAMRNREPRYNHYSILDDWARVSAEDLVREYRGSSPDNWGYQIEGIRRRLERILERHILVSPRVAPSATERGSMGGLLWWATRTDGAAGTSYITTAETFTLDVFGEGMEYLYGAGTLDNNADVVCLVPPAAMRSIAKLDRELMRGEYSNETVRGLRCTRLLCPITGTEVPLVPVANLAPDSFMLLNLNAVRIQFLKGLALAVFNQDVGFGMNAFRAGRLYSVISMEVHRPLENIYYHEGISWA